MNESGIDWFPIKLSFAVASAATLIALVAGAGLAWLLARKRFPGRDLIDAVITLPLVTKSLRAAFEGVDPQMEAAARTLGLNARRIFFRVTLPLASRGVLAATALAFARALGDFGVTIMIAGNIPGRTQTASVAIYDAVQAGRDNEAFTLAVIVSLIAVVMRYFINHFRRKGSGQ